MKDIRKIFNIKKSNKTPIFSFKELVTISLIFSIICCFLTGLVIFSITNTSLKYDQAKDDILGTYNKIMKNYYKEVDSNEIADAAIDGMLNFLNEKYSVYLNSDDTDDLNERLQGSYQGIGIAIIKDTNGNTIINEVYDNTPASKSGLKAKDIITEINGKKVDYSVSNEEIVELIKDTEEISLTIIRDNKELSFELKKNIVDYPVTTVKTFNKGDKKIGYIYLSVFSSTSDSQVSNALKKLENDKIDSLVLDLRANSGGYLTSASKIASLFLSKGKVIYFLEDKEKNEKVYDKTEEKRSYDIVVLIDENTASAAELLAASLHESYGAILIGHNSYGKGKVQEMNTLSDDTMFKITTAKWFTPNGDSIDTIGLKPDIYVSITEEYSKNPIDDNDDQLQMALYVLANK